LPTLAAFLLLSCAAEAQSTRAAPPSSAQAKPTPDQKAEAAAPSNLPVVRLIATGGTIAMKIDPVKKAPVPGVDTFKSGDLGFLGYADSDRVVWYRAPTRRQHVALRALAEGQHLPRVDIVPMYGGADGTFVRAAIAAGAKGLVIQALGWGNMNIPMFQAVKEAMGKGIPVAISTRVWTGRVLPNYGFEGGGKTLQQAGAVFADDLSPQKARILLMLALQTTSNAQELQRMFDR